MKDDVDEAECPKGVERTAKMMRVHPSRLLPHDGIKECAVCGCSPGERHNLASHDHDGQITGG